MVEWPGPPDPGRYTDLNSILIREPGDCMELNIGLLPIIGIKENDLTSGIRAPEWS
jgi:hypothetical protein